MFYLLIIKWGYIKILLSGYGKMYFVFILSKCVYIISSIYRYVIV